jgi:hypothetical protein
MNASEARRKTIENSPLFTLIMSDIDRAIREEEFEIYLHKNYHFHDWTPIGEAVVKVLRDKGFKVKVNDYDCTTTISWK